MPIFSYKAKDRRGEIVAGNLDADSRAAATARLQAMGLFPIAIQGGEERSAAGPSRVKRALKVELRRGGRIRSEDLADFYRQMSDADLAAIIAYLRAVVNPRDEVAFLRIANMPRRGIGDATLHQVHALCLAENIPFAKGLS
ncbi:MAG TPA: hypothetical protein PK847_09805, partial [Candidatus Sumerlaeota bacterium]|nr:hypothetical protein [Candidatus Sumerlaeota bacterium]